jgi:hypothetical protein
MGILGVLVIPFDGLPGLNDHIVPHETHHRQCLSPRTSRDAGEIHTVSFLAARMNPECTLSEVELITAWKSSDRITFTNPGTYPYICALHDNLGMQGEIIVLP